MPIEIRMLTFAALLALIQISAAAVAKRFQEPRGWGAGSRDEPPPRYTGAAARLDRASANMLETFPIFVALVVAVRLSGESGRLTVLGTQLYFWSRMIYVPVYAAGLPYLRTLIYVVSLLGLALIFAALL